jgi:hypothetical protein
MRKNCAKVRKNLCILVHCSLLDLYLGGGIVVVLALTDWGNLGYISHRFDGYFCNRVQNGWKKHISWIRTGNKNGR